MDDGATKQSRAWRWKQSRGSQWSLVHRSEDGKQVLRYYRSSFSPARFQRRYATRGSISWLSKQGSATRFCRMSAGSVPKWRARIGHARTQVGSHPQSISSWQPSHLTAMPVPASVMAWKGQASTHAPQPVQVSWSINTQPCMSFEIASTGHTSAQGGSAQW